MDETRFDALTRSLGTAGSRRRALGGLLLGSLGLLGWQGEDDLAAHDLKAKCKKKSGDAKKKCLKKAKKHAAQHASEIAPGCTPSCAGKQCGPNGCGGSCGTCSVVGQVCDAAGQCVCPACGPNQVPDSFFRTALQRPCACCTRNGVQDPVGSGGTNCCSRSTIGEVCTAKQASESCDNDYACLTENCVQQKCSSCTKSADYCQLGSFAGGTCGSNGKCLKSVDGTTRCGIPLASNPDSCGVCNANDDCDQGQFPGRFCAVNTGSTGNCPCANGQTFCASPA